VTLPSEKMKRLYHHFIERYGEPKDVWVFDPAEFKEPAPPFLGLTHVMAWPADRHCDVTTFQSLGMSDRRMKGARYFAEVHWGIRAKLKKQQRLEVARRIADVCAYPFQYDRKLDWWEVIKNPGPLPGFEGCKHLLLHPKLAAQAEDRIKDEDGLIKLLFLVPITPQERHLIVDHGRDALTDHLSANEVDVLSDRFAPPEWYEGEP
jgi:hypothetical protein